MRQVALLVVLVSLPVAVCQTFTEIDVTVPAVSQDDSGLAIGVPVRLNIRMMTPGTGEVFVNTRALTQMDMQGSARVAAMVAAELTGRDLRTRDFYVTLYADTTIIGGPSAGGAMAVAMTALIEGVKMRSDVIMTGMITPDGAIGVVGGIPEKAVAAHLAGARYFLVPEGQSMSYNLTTLEIVNVTELARERWNLTVVEIGDIREAVLWFTDLEYRPRSYPPIPVPIEVYLEMLETHSLDELAQATEMLSIVRDDLSASGIGEPLRSSLESQLAISEEDILLGYQAYNRSWFYVASSKAFQSKIRTTSVSYNVRFYSAAETDRDAVIGEIWTEVEDEIRDVEAFMASAEIRGITGLQSHAAAQSRAEEAKASLQDSMYLRYLQYDDLALYHAAYALERAHTARFWLYISSGTPSLLIPRPDDLRDLAERLVADAAILATYADLLYEEILLPIQWVVFLMPEYGFIDPYESLARAQLGVEEGLWDMAVFEALESEVRSGLAIEFINVLVRAENEADAVALMRIMASRSELDARVAIENSRSIGVEPILSVSRFEFSLHLMETDEISALGEAVFGLRFARSAARLSAPLLDLYRPILELPELDQAILTGNATISGSAYDPNGDPLTLRIDVAGLHLESEIPQGIFSMVVPTSGLGDGTYLLVANLSDGVLCDTRSMNVSVDNNPPSVVFVNIQNSTVYGSSITPQFEVRDAVDPAPDTRVELDGSPFAGGEVAEEGRHVLSVLTEDRAGWSRRVEVTFWIDTTPPLVETAQPRSNGTYITSPARLVWAAMDSGTWISQSSLRIDGGPWIEPGEVNQTLIEDEAGRLLVLHRFASSIALTDGFHLIEMMAVDGAGNSHSVILRIAVDTKPPDIGISGVMDGAWYNRTVRVGVQTRDDMDPRPLLNISLDDRPYVDGTPIGHGAHRIEAISTDRAGNSRLISRHFVVDMLPPRIWANITPGAVFDHLVVVSCFWEDDLDPSPAGQILLDGAEYRGSVVLPGAHILHLSASDRAGNAHVITSDFIVDVQPPTIWASVADLSWSNEPVSVSWKVADDLDPDPYWQALMDDLPHTAPMLVGEGKHNLQIDARDWAGNSRKLSITFYVDGTPPVLRMSNLQNATCYSSPIWPQLEVHDSLDESPTVAWLLNGDPFTPGTAIGDGQHILIISAVDRANNLASLFITFSVDTTPPSITMSVREGARYRGSLIPKIEARDEGGKVTIITILDGEPYEIGTRIGPGTHTISVLATDAVGNTARSKVVFLVKARVPAGWLGGTAALAAVLTAYAVLAKTNWSRRRRRGL